MHHQRFLSLLAMLSSLFFRGSLHNNTARRAARARNTVSMRLNEVGLNAFRVRVFLCFAFQNIDVNSVPRHSSNSWVSSLSSEPVLTAGGHQADDNRGGGRRTLDQHGHQDSHHQARHRVRQHRVVLENVPCHFPWISMQRACIQRQKTHALTQKLRVCDMTGLPRAMLDEIQSACFHISEKVTDVAACIPQRCPSGTR